MRPYIIVSLISLRNGWHRKRPVDSPWFNGWIDVATQWRWPGPTRTLRQLLQLATKLHSRRVAGSSSVPPGLARQLAQAGWGDGIPGLLGKGCFGVCFLEEYYYIYIYLSQILGKKIQKKGQQKLIQILNSSNQYLKDLYYLGGGLKHFLFTPLPGEMIQFD